MQLTIRVDQHDGNGPQDIKTTMWAMVAWERKYNVKIAQLSEKLGIEDIAFITYETLRSLKRTTPASFEDFLKKNPDIEILGAGDDSPIPGAATAAS